MKIRIELSYDGTNYCGWQVQPNGNSIQEELQKALFVFTRQKITVTGSGRTDAGVHARAQVAHFSVEAKLDLFTLQRALNGILPYDIRVITVEEVDESFHARFDAKGKVYHYYLCTKACQDPFRRRYSHHVRHSLDLDLLRAGARCFLGTHNFRAFANEGYQGSAGRNPVRTIRRLDVVEEGNGFVRLEFEADSFLYKMVRNITGTLLDLCAGKCSLDEIPKMLVSEDRKKAGKAAPALGLFMEKVFY